MIEFHLDPRSGVATYLQIVQQVKDALRLGTLDVGDQLPTVREVVADLAINPNTVAKAYRELEREGLVVARQGRGTFVAEHARARLAAAPRRRCARELERWLDVGRRAGLDEESIRALISTTLRESLGPPRGMNAPPLDARGLGKRFRREWALRDCTLDDPGGRDRRPGRAERGGKVDAALARGRAARADRGLDRGARARPAARARRCSPRSATSRRARRSTARSRVAETIEFARRTNSRWDDEIVAELLDAHRLADEGRRALGRRARAARARARARQAAAARPARRAVRAASTRSPAASSCSC